MRTLITSYKRSLALFLAIVLCLGVPQMSALAESGSNDLSESETGETTPSTEDITPAEAESAPNGETEEADAGKNEDISETSSQISVDLSKAVELGEDGNPIPPDGFALSEQGDGAWTYAQSGEDGEVRTDENGNPLSTWKVIEVRDPESGEVVGYEVAVEAKETEDVEYTEETEKTGASNKVIPGTFEENTDKKVDEHETERDDWPLDVKDWLVLESSGNSSVVIGEDGKPVVIGDGKNGITVTMTPNSQDWVGVTVNVEAILAGLKGEKPTDAVPYKDPADPERKTIGYQTESVSEEGDTKTTVTTIVTDITDASGNVIGYKTTVITETRKKDGETTTTETIKQNPGTPVRGEETTVIKLPEGYEVGEDSVFDETTRNTTTVKVEELYEEDEEGKPVVVGYLTTTVVTDENGNEVSSSKESVWGIKTVTTMITTTSTEDQKITVTSSYLVTRATTIDGLSIEVTDITGGKHCGVGGEAYKVAVGDNHGKETSAGLNPDMDKEPSVGRTDTVKDLFNRADAVKVTATSLNVRDGAGTENTSVIGSLKTGDIVFVSETKKVGNTIWGKIGDGQWISLSWANETQPPVEQVAPDEKFLYLGQYGLESAIRVNGEGKTDGTWQPHQFVILDQDGKEHYVYCADFEVSPKKGTVYGMTNVEDVGNYWSTDSEKNLEIAQKIEAIAKYGYWGTESGAGSLDAVKQMLKDVGKEVTGLTDTEVDLLTDGMALTATQAAIWSYATSGQKINVKDPFGCYNLDNEMLKGEDATTYFTAEEEKVALALYNYLRNQSESIERPDVEEIKAKNIIKTSITVKELNRQDGTPVALPQELQDDSTNTRYEYVTDVSFILDVAPSKINSDNMLVKIFAADTKEEIGTWRIDTGNTRANDHGTVKATKDKDGNWIYTIENVVLAEGVKVTLNLSGSQVVDRGAYLVTARTEDGDENSKLSQTFIAAGEKRREVDLSIDLEFNVREPSAQKVKTNAQKEESRTDISESTVYQTVTRQNVEREVVVSAAVRNEYRQNNVTGGDDDDTPTPAPTPTPGGDDDDTPTPPGGDDDDDTPVIPDDPTPLDDEPGIEIPDDPTPLGGAPEIEIADDPVPLAEAPMAVTLSDAMLVELPEDPVPLADVLVELPDEDVPLADLVDLFDEDVPLADVPETGDISTLWYVLILTAGGCLLAMSIADERKKRHQALAN